MQCWIPIVFGRIIIIFLLLLFIYLLLLFSAKTICTSETVKAKFAKSPLLLRQQKSDQSDQMVTLYKHFYVLGHNSVTVRFSNKIVFFLDSIYPNEPTRISHAPCT